MVPQQFVNSIAYKRTFISQLISKHFARSAVYRKIRSFVLITPDKVNMYVQCSFYRLRGLDRSIKKPAVHYRYYSVSRIVQTIKKIRYAARVKALAYSSVFRRVHMSVFSFLGTEYLFVYGSFYSVQGIRRCTEKYSKHYGYYATQVIVRSIENVEYINHIIS